MNTTHKLNLLAAALIGALAFTTTITRAQDPLPAWNDGATKKSIVEFVTKVTTPGSRSQKSVLFNSLLGGA